MTDETIGSDATRGHARASLITDLCVDCAACRERHAFDALFAFY